MSDSLALDPLSKQQGFKFVSITELSPEQKQVLKDTVAKDTTDTELAYFLNVSLAQDLDPFRKEVWCIKYSGRLTVQTGRDGFLKIAKRDPTFDFIQSAEVREGDTFTMDPITGQVEHRLTTKRGQILGAYAIITRKDGVKLTKYVTYSEYFDGSSSMWKDYPTAMITKCAESVLCKQFANVTGIVAEETMRKDGVVIDSSPSAQARQSSLKDDLVGKIDSCKTIEDLNALSQASAGDIGKLFEPERREVMEAAKRRRIELTAVEVAPEQPQQAPELPLEPDMPEEEFASYLDAVHAHETAEGLDDLRQLVESKPMSALQRQTLASAIATAKEALKPKKKKA